MPIGAWTSSWRARVLSSGRKGRREPGKRGRFTSSAGWNWRTVLPPVNAALQHALQYRKLGQAFSLSLSRAGRTYYEPGGDTRRFKPDWPVCAAGRVSTFEDGSYRYLNLLPGDSKLSNKWNSSFYESMEDRAYWEDPVRQIVHYCINSDSRYGFIITDEELVEQASPWGTGAFLPCFPQAQTSLSCLPACEMCRLQTLPRHFGLQTLVWTNIQWNIGQFLGTITGRVSAI